MRYAFACFLASLSMVMATATTASDKNLPIIWIGVPFNGMPACVSNDPKVWHNCGGIAFVDFGYQIYTSTAVFKNGKAADGLHITTLEKKNLPKETCTYNMKSGKIDGWKKCVNPNGQIVSETFYVNGESSPEASKDREIAKYRSECERIGFTPKTDKLADCILRLMEMNSVSKEIAVTQPQKSDSAAIRTLLEEERRQRQLDGALELMKQGQNLTNPPNPKITCQTNHITGTTTCY